MIDKIKNRIIDQKENLLVALKLMDFIDKKLLLVFEGSKFINILSVGDIQRAILKNNSLDTPVKSILRENTRIASEEDSYSAIKKLMNQNRIECMPVVNKKKELIKVYFWEDVFGEDEKRNQCKLNLPVVIMAGGKGTRLKPFTNVIPKPIIPIGDKTIIEEIMYRFVDVGCD